MKELEKKQTYRSRVKQWGAGIAERFQDLSISVLCFIPNGLEGLYDSLLSRIPFIGAVFRYEWTSKFIKALTGIIPIQMVAHDIGRFVFYPVGYTLGVVIGLVLALFMPNLPIYRGRIGQVLHMIAPQTVFGALVGIGAYTLAQPVLPAGMHQSLAILAFIVGGSVFGFIAKLMYLIATNIILTANAATIRKNVDKARSLSLKLKAAAKHKAKIRIVQLAEKTIQQINGQQLQSKLNHFFSEHYETISTHAYKKIDRHLNYLTDRACHGDLQALRRLFGLVPGRQTLTQAHNADLDAMLERIFNPRAITKMQDDIDTVFDVWQYRHLQKNPEQHPILAKI